MTEIIKTISEEKAYLMRKHLAKWRDYAYILASARGEIERLDEYMISYPATLGSTPVQGGSSKREDCLVNTIDAKVLLEAQLECANNYFAELKPAWDTLTDEEKDYITLRYIDPDTDIHDVMRKYHIEKTEAYQRCNNAVMRLASVAII